MFQDSEQLKTTLRVSSWRATLTKMHVRLSVPHTYAIFGMYFLTLDLHFLSAFPLLLPSLFPNRQQLMNSNTMLKGVEKTQGTQKQSLHMDMTPQE